MEGVSYRLEDLKSGTVTVSSEYTVAECIADSLFTGVPRHGGVNPLTNFISLSVFVAMRSHRIIVY